MTDQLLKQITDCAITPALKLLPGSMDTPQARVMLLAIGLQESGLTKRVQFSPRAPGGRGPARGLWQNEKGGMVSGVLACKATRSYAAKLCSALDVDADPLSVWTELEHNDILAAVFARLGLFAEPSALPALGDQDAAWAYYLKTWRPGSPRPGEWGDYYQRALKFVTGA